MNEDQQKLEKKEVSWDTSFFAMLDRLICCSRIPKQTSLWKELLPVLKQQLKTSHVQIQHQYFCIKSFLHSSLGWDMTGQQEVKLLRCFMVRVTVKGSSDEEGLKQFNSKPFCRDDLRTGEKKHHQVSATGAYEPYLMSLLQCLFTSWSSLPAPLLLLSSLWALCFTR